MPKHDELLILVDALLANAMALVDDASLLYENDRFPRAYALAALAGEELGKVYLCLGALLHPGEVDERQFWMSWRQHGDKLDSMRAYAAAFIDDLESLNIDQLRADAGRMQAQKLAAFYVDFDGELPVAPDRVTEADAATLLQTARQSVSHASAALAELHIDVVSAARALGPEMATFFDRLLDGKPPEQALAALRQLLVEAPTMAPGEIVELLKSKGASSGR